MDSYRVPSGKGKRMYSNNDEEEAPEVNGRRKKRTSRDQDAGSDDITEFRILCPISKIGGLIGRGGAKISALRQECKSKISVEDPVPGSEERVVYISSSSQKDTRMQSLCPAQEALLRVHAKIVAEGAPSDEEEPSHVTARILVPHNQIGCVLGKAGKIIEQMRKDIPCQIRVMPKDQLPACAFQSDEMVQLSGDPILVEKALNAVSSRLYENPPRERPQGDFEGVQGPPILPALSTGGGLYSSGGYASKGVPLLGPTSVGGGPMVGLGGYPYSSIGGYPAPGIASGRSLGSGLGSIRNSATHFEVNGTEEEFTLRVLCPIEKVGGVIGKGGSVVRKMRDESQARIQVRDPVPECDERVIEITSTEVMEGFTSSGIEAALLVHQCLVDLQSEKERDNNTFTVRLLVPTSDVGCLLGKGGSIITEMRNMTRASIKIPKKEELPACADESVDDLVQITGDQVVVHDALLQVLNRLRANIFKGYDGVVHPFSRMAYSGNNPASMTYGGRLDMVPSGGLSYPLTNMGRGLDYGGYGGGLQTPSARVSKEFPRRKQ